MSAPETILRKRILDALHARGIWAQPNNIRLKGRAKQGLGVGSADIIAMVTLYADLNAVATVRVGRLVGLEVKLPKKGAKYTDEQKAWAQAINDRGGYVVVVRSVEDAMAAVTRAAKGEAA